MKQVMREKPFGEELRRDFFAENKNRMDRTQLELSDGL